MSNKKLSFEDDPVFECFKSERRIAVKDAAMAIMDSLGVLSKASQSVAKAKEALPEEIWYALVNTVTMTLLSAMNTVGMTEQEAIDFASRVSAHSPSVESIKLVLVPDADDDDDIPKA